MFLPQIINSNKFQTQDNSKIAMYKRFIEKLQKRVFILNQIKSNKNYYLSVSSTQIDSKEQDLAFYIVNFIVTNKDTILYVTDVKGNLHFYSSASSFKITGKQKIKQPATLLKILRSFLTNTKTFKAKPIVLHFSNIKKQFVKILVRILEKIFFIKAVKTYNFLLPHNGCRPKKIKRKKYNQLKFK